MPSALSWLPSVSLSYAFDDIDPIQNALDAPYGADRLLSYLFQEVARHFAAQSHDAFLTVALELA